HRGRRHGQDPPRGHLLDTRSPALTPPPAPRTTGPVLLVVAGGAVSQAAIARTAELAAGAPVTVVGVGTTEISRTEAASSPPLNSTPAAGKTRPQGPSTLTCEPEQVRRTVALAMSVLESTGIVAVGHIVTGSPTRAVARLMAELRRRMYGSGTIVLAETDRRGGWVSA